MPDPLDIFDCEPASAASIGRTGPAGATPDPVPAERRYIGVLFECCGVYARIYRSETETAYVGRCPGCLRPLRVGVGPEGTNCRIFRAQ